MNKKSVYKFAAEAGLPIGLYLILISACFLLSLKVDFLLYLIIPLLLGFPFLMAHFMKKMVREEASYERFSPIWLFGIYSIIFGTLICMLFSTVYLTFIDPSFITSYVTGAIANIQASPMADSYASTVEMMQEAIDAHMLPNGTQFVTTMAWFTCFAGSMLSLILAAVISHAPTKKSVSMFR